MKVIAVLPAYNEEKRIKDTILKTKRYVDNIIVVDDGSEDKTAEASKKSGADVIRYEKNRGVGYATRVGLKRAISLKPDIIIFLDADGQHDPKYIPQFIKAIENGADYVCGWRDLSNYPLDRKIGNWGLQLLTNLLCHTGIKDTECGYRAMALDAAKKIKLKGERYEKDSEFAYEVWRNKLKISQVKIVVPVFHPKGAIIRGFKNFFYLLRRRFNLV
jgi:glycosyltransferase involved in cell wall biosynthesis